MITRSLLIVTTMLISFLASAHNFTIGQRVPAIGVEDKGELQYSNDTFSYNSWNAAKLPGKVRVIQHIAGRSSAKALNAPLIEAIVQAKLPHDIYQTTTIINTDDAIIGTGIFVRNSIESGKKAFPWSQVIVDSKGVVKKAWDLKPQSSTIVVLDKAGRVQFAKEGKLTPEEVQQVVDLLHQLTKA